MTLEPTVIERFEHIVERWNTHGDGSEVLEHLPVPKWQFLCWLTDEKNLLLHGSGNPSITEFQPRTPHDLSDDEFSKQTAVFAASDGLWPMFYAILDRDLHRLNFLNAALRFERPDGSLSDVRYFFSVSRPAFEHRPWRSGTVYVLPRDGFVMQPPYPLGSFTVHDPHWARLEPVKPLARIRVSPEDFPFLDAVRGHDHGTVQARFRANPGGFPWLEDE